MGCECGSVISGMEGDKLLTRKGFKIDLDKLHEAYGYNWEHITNCCPPPTTIEEVYRQTETFRLCVRRKW
jgi:hypothetical protein